MFFAQKISVYKFLHFSAVEAPHFRDYELFDRDKLSVLKFHYFAEKAVEVRYFAVALAFDRNEAHWSLAIKRKRLHVFRKTLNFFFPFFCLIIELGNFYHMKRRSLSDVQNHFEIVVRYLLQYFISLLELFNYLMIKNFYVIILNL